MDAASGILGSISIVCWVVVFSPQILQNYQRHSAEGLSLEFLVIWLVGDALNIAAALMQGVLPTMIILAFYYTIADAVLILQCIYYRYASRSTKVPGDGPRETDPLFEEEETPAPVETGVVPQYGARPSIGGYETSFPPDLLGPILSRTTSRNSLPYIFSPPVEVKAREPSPLSAQPGPSKWASLKPAFQSASAVLVVVVVGVIAWWIGTLASGTDEDNTQQPGGLDSDDLQLDIPAQVLGYMSAALYIGARVPQIVLNYKRKSTEGVSMFFFLFAFIGNLTYALSIFAHSPPPCADAGHCMSGEAAAIYRRYLLVNASWILGGIGSPTLDSLVFIQFLRYRERRV